MKGYTVFNVEQIDGLPDHYYAKPQPRIDTVQRIDRAEAFFAGTGAAIRHGGTMAYYNVSQDFVQMPPFEAFRDAESYYATLAHETTHYADLRIMPRRGAFLMQLRSFGAAYRHNQRASRKASSLSPGR
jgi:antirestriction protein ArdC